MCITPSFIWVERGPKWEHQPVACKKCWSCLKRRVDDYVGRSLCEASTSLASVALTLTYRDRADGYDRFINPSHFQLFMKLLRRRGHLVRYLVAGEYGSLKGRAHFHCILFFKGLIASDVMPSYDRGHEYDPDLSAPFSALLPSKRNVHLREWPHGHVFADWASSEATTRYVCKYLLDASKKNGWFSASRKPPLGHEYFADMARRFVDLGAMPRALEYIPPGMSSPVPLTRTSRTNFLLAVGAHLGNRVKLSEYVRNACDQVERQLWLREIELLEAQADLDATVQRFADRQALYDKEQARKRLTINDLLETAPSGILRLSQNEWVPE